MKWTTWEGVGIDRIACAWLIRRRIDPGAEFVFVPVGGALPADTEPFDVPGERLSHPGGHCSFHAFLAAYGLDDPVLARIGRIVDEADTVQEAALEAAAPGVDLICRGLRRTSSTDHEAIERGAVVYDALYAELREGDAP
jgi:hypothetical protein